MRRSNRRGRSSRTATAVTEGILETRSSTNMSCFLFGRQSTSLVLVLIVTALSCAVTVMAEEIQATHEWTLLGENDTIAAGMHVRIDLEKGQRWVKLPDDENGNEEGQHVQIDAGGKQQQVALMTQSEESIAQNQSSTKEPPELPIVIDKKQDEEPPLIMDFDMMHRTLSKLPVEEQQRLKLPQHVVDKSDTTNRPAFEEQMKAIWLQRQDELRELEHIDLPKILKERIQQMQDYFMESDRLAALKRVDIHRPHEIGVLDPTDIVSVLFDLEYQLTDIDMTRDFYTLGGWPLLVSLLDSRVLALLTNNTTTSSDVDDYMTQAVNLVQSHAAWCIGSAVKNQEEFYHLANLPIENAYTRQQSSALALLTDQIVALKDTSFDLLENQKMNKFLYALGALLRGNRDAQTYFCANMGSDILEVLLTRAMDHNSSGARKIAMRLLTMAEDLIADTNLHSSSSRQVDEAIADSFTTEPWCQASLRALSDPIMSNDAVLKTVRVMLPHCVKLWDRKTIEDTLDVLSSTWKKEAPDVDPDVQKDRMMLLESVIDEVKHESQ